jgi:single-strand DNA-binding protein
MPSFNKSVLVGNLCKDPVVKTVGEKQTSLCTFSIGVNNTRSQNEETLYMNISVWGKNAENCQAALHKGSLVLVEGRIRTSKMDNGSYWTEVVADVVQFLDKKQKNENGESSAFVETEKIDKSDVTF